MEHLKADTVSRAFKAHTHRYAMNQRFNRIALVVLFLSLGSLTGCQHVVIDTEKLLRPSTELSEIVGFLAGLGTTFAAFPDLLAMLRRRSSLGMNPRMSAIMGVFQVLWIYYGLLIASRPVIIWNVIAVLINFLTVGAYTHFLKKERQGRDTRSS